MDNTRKDKVVPGSVEVATFAAVVDRIAADHVLGREDDIDFSSRGNAKSVGQGSSGRESPARTTVLLVSDGVDALGPLLSGIEAIRDSSKSLGGLGDVTRNSDALGTQELLGFSKRDTLESLVSTGSPAQVVLVHLLDDVIIKGHGFSFIDKMNIEGDTSELSAVLITKGDLTTVFTSRGEGRKSLVDSESGLTVSTGLDGALDLTREQSAEVKSLVEDGDRARVNDGDLGGTGDDNFLKNTRNGDTEVATDGWGVGGEGDRGKLEFIGSRTAVSPGLLGQSH